MKVEAITLVGVDGTPLTLFEKRLSTRELTVAEAAQRLRGEADLLGALGGRVTPRLVGRGDDERGPWLRTEGLAFPTLAGRLARAGRPGGALIDPAWVERAVRAAFTALAELHDACDEAGPLQIVHADVSPANVAVDDAGARAVFLDLELASWRGSGPRDGAFRGTIAYSAPEIARGEVPTVRSDVFALAATFLHLAIGAPPREGPSLAAMLGAAAERPLLEELRVARVDLASRGRAHAALVRCLAHHPDDRPASAREVLSLLDGGRLC
jgi:eukaryotic-like serine/threonine-protein kinase